MATTNFPSAMQQYLSYGAATATRDTYNRLLQGIPPYDAIQGMKNPLPTPTIKPAAPAKESWIMTAITKPSGFKSLLIVVAASVLCWKIWCDRDQIAAKIETLALELQEKLGLNKPTA